MESLAHELKHAHQFETFELDFVVDLASGKSGGGLLYDKTDEYAAYRRGNLFGNEISNNEKVVKKHLDPVGYVNSQASYKRRPDEKLGLYTDNDRVIYDHYAKKREKSDGLRYVINTR